MKQRKLADLRSPRSGSAAWGCPRSTAPPTRTRRSRRSSARSSSGINFLDTAQLYGPLTNEELVGRAIKGHRDEYVIATKFARRIDDGDAGRHVDRRSARRLGRARPQLDRGLAAAPRHRPRRPLLPAPRRPRRRRSRRRSARWRSWSRQGKVRHIGLSEAAPETIRRAHAVHPITAVQTEYSLWTRDPEAEVLPDLPRARHRLRPLLAARARLPLRALHVARGARRGRLPPQRPALHRREPRGEPEARRQGRGDRRREGRHARPARDRLGARPGRGPGADPRHQAPQLPGAERGARSTSS